MNENKTEQQTDYTSMSDEELKIYIQETLDKMRKQYMMFGAQAICQAIADRIYAFESSGYKKAIGHYRQLVKEIRKFCETGIPAANNPGVPANSTNQPDDKTVQN